MSKKLRKLEKRLTRIEGEMAAIRQMSLLKPGAVVLTGKDDVISKLTGEQVKEWMSEIKQERIGSKNE